jgi:LmbE family N-acetylglucosaminyl deacetylase
VPGRDARVVVVAPHPDDEVLGAGGLLARLARDGTPATVVYVTSGDGYHEAAGLDPAMCPTTPWRLRDLGRTRDAEARVATSRLGLRPDQLRFLGFPDGSLAELWAAHWWTPWQSPDTAIDDVPYPDAVAPRAPYTGASVVHVLASTLAALRPTLVVTAHPLDAHPDHAATGWFTVTAARRAVPDAALRFFVVHDPCWPPVSAEWRATPAPPAARFPDTRWRAFTPTPADRAEEVWALDAYRTQLAVMPGTLYRFLGPREVFGAIDDAALARMIPPPGTLPPPHGRVACDGP